MARMPKSRLTTPDPDGPHGQMPRAKKANSAAPKGSKLSSGPGNRFGAGKGMGSSKGC